jgi:hypothetical protein
MHKQIESQQGDEVREAPADAAAQLQELQQQYGNECCPNLNAHGNKLVNKLLLTPCAGFGGDGVGAGRGSGQQSGGWWYGAGGGPGHCTGQAAEEGSFRVVLYLSLWSAV